MTPLRPIVKPCGSIRRMPRHGLDLGATYGKLNHYDDAVEAYRQAVRINPENAQAWVDLGVDYVNLNRYDDAMEAYRQALRINPEDTEAWFDLGFAYGLSGDRIATLDTIRKLQRLDPAMADKLYNALLPR